MAAFKEEMRTVLRRSVKKPVLLLPSFVRELVPTFLWACACACSYLDSRSTSELVPTYVPPDLSCSYISTAGPLKPTLLHKDSYKTASLFMVLRMRPYFLTDLKAIVFPHQRFVDMWEHLKLFPVLWDILKFPFQLFATEWNRGFLASLSSVYIN